jgi:NAD(P)-dependent dehydrogenase (short-subunit alcohol dehydrogenase family)
MKFQGKSALVTGSSEGIGYAIAAGLVAQGARVMLNGRREDKLAEAARALGSAASYVVGDVSDPAAAPRIVDETVARQGGLDLLVNNVGVLFAGMVGGLDLDGVQRMMSVNLTGTILMTDAAVRVMRGRPGAAILLISSQAAFNLVPGITVYGATKAAIEYLARGWAVELAPAGIRVNCLRPGGTDTPAFRTGEAYMPGMREQFIKGSLIKRIATPEDMVAPALLLLDEKDGAFITGSIMTVDGGCTLDRS